MEDGKQESMWAVLSSLHFEQSQAQKQARTLEDVQGVN